MRATTLTDGRSRALKIFILYEYRLQRYELSAIHATPLYGFNACMDLILQSVYFITKRKGVLCADNSLNY